MQRIPRVVLGLTFLGSLLGAVSSTTHAASSCGGRVICDHTLGIALTQPAGWRRLPASKVPAHEIDLVRPGSGLNYDERLVIRPFGMTSLSNSLASARLAARKLIAAERATRLTQVNVRYAGSSAVVLRGLPGPNPAADILLAHGRYVYLIIVPGHVIAADQQAALNTLRFIPRVGPFPGSVGGGR